MGVRMVSWLPALWLTRILYGCLWHGFGMQKLTSVSVDRRYHPTLADYPREELRSLARRHARLRPQRCSSDDGRTRWIRQRHSLLRLTRLVGFEVEGADLYTLAHSFPWLFYYIYLVRIRVEVERWILGMWMAAVACITVIGDYICMVSILVPASSHIRICRYRTRIVSQSHPLNQAFAVSSASTTSDSSLLQSSPLLPANNSTCDSYHFLLCSAITLCRSSCDSALYHLENARVSWGLMWTVGCTVDVDISTEEEEEGKEEVEARRTSRGRWVMFGPKGIAGLLELERGGEGMEMEEGWPGRSMRADT